MAILTLTEDTCKVIRALLHGETAEHPENIVTAALEFGKDDALQVLRRRPGRRSRCGTMTASASSQRSVSTRSATTRTRGPGPSAPPTTSLLTSCRS